MDYFWRHHNIGISDIEKLPGFESFEVTDVVELGADSDEEEKKEPTQASAYGSITRDELIEESKDSYGLQQEPLKVISEPYMRNIPLASNSKGKNSQLTAMKWSNSELELVGNNHHRRNKVYPTSASYENDTTVFDGEAEAATDA